MDGLAELECQLIFLGAGNRQITGYVVGLGEGQAYPAEKINILLQELSRESSHCSERC